MQGDILTANEVAYARGRKLFKDGKPRPDEPTDDDVNGMSVSFCVWLGWMVERASAYFERRRVMEILGVSDEN